MRYCCSIAVCFLTAACARPAAAQTPSVLVAGAIRTAISGHNAGVTEFFASQRAELVRVYEPDGYRALWVDASGRPNRSAGDALALLDAASAEGLDPADYGAPALAAAAAALARAPAAAGSETAIAQFDRDLSAGMLRYFRHLHAGRVDPRAIGFRIEAPRDDEDYAALLRRAVASDRIKETAASLAPQLPLYRALRGVLARYRTLAADPSLAPPVATQVVVRPGQRYESAAALQHLLIALGDMPAAAPTAVDSPIYEGPLVDGVRHFQMRHGLQSDGVLGKTTQAALHVPLSWRARQIELGLERLRWLPQLALERLLAVNIPMFRLWVWDTTPAKDKPSFGMGVIVGKALNTRTPVFMDEVEYLIFRPYWNVPASIVRGEILPRIGRDPDYLQREDMEIVSGAGDDARPVPASAEALELLRQGRLRLRQRPGPKNALGRVKFVFPNDADVYLHDTPAPHLFLRPRRDFSHGCVRVEDPVALAEWALKGQGDWNRESIVAAMNGSRSLRVELAHPVQVILFYITAAVMPDDGTIHFAEDIYGHDAKLNRALGKSRSATD